MLFKEVFVVAVVQGSSVFCCLKRVGLLWLSKEVWFVVVVVVDV